MCVLEYFCCMNMYTCSRLWRLSQLLYQPGCDCECDCGCDCDCDCVFTPSKCTALEDFRAALDINPSSDSIKEDIRRVETRVESECEY